MVLNYNGAEMKPGVFQIVWQSQNKLSVNQSVNRNTQKIQKLCNQNFNRRYEVLFIYIYKFGIDCRIRPRLSELSERSLFRMSTFCLKV